MTPAAHTALTPPDPPGAAGGRRGPIGRGAPATVAALIIAALLVALLTLGGCGSGSDSSAPTANGLPKEIVIGAAIGKTGYMAPYDASIEAVEYLADRANAQGGIDGHKIRVVQADTRSEPQQAVVAAQKVVDDGADLLFLSGEALTAAAEAPVAEENGMLNFAVVNEPGYGPPTTGPLSFSSNPSLLSEVSSAATFLHEKGLEQPFLFRDTSLIYGKAACSGFQQAWERLGGTIAGAADFTNSDESVATQVGELKRSGADVVVICSYPPGGAAAIKQIRAAGIDVPIYGPGTFDGTFWIKGVPDTDNIYVTTNGSSYDPPDPATARVLGRLQRAGVDTDYSNNLLAAYAAGELMLAAIRETGSVDGQTLADALEAKPHKTILGTISYSRDDHYPTRTWPIYVFSHRTEHFVKKVKPPFIPDYGG
jgi:branched-chain amino acid transport system substrate-binding protein